LVQVTPHILILELIANGACSSNGGAKEQKNFVLSIACALNRETATSVQSPMINTSHVWAWEVKPNINEARKCTSPTE